MVSNVFGFGRSGLSDWVVQRVSAVVLLAYIIYLTAVLLLTPEMGYQEWQALFEPFWMKLFSLFAVLSLCAHAWVGMWTIGTDYITTRLMGRAGTALRVLYQLGCLALILAYFVWCVQILWGN